MCDSCGCAPESSALTIKKLGDPVHDHGRSRTVRVEQDVLARNREISAANRKYFEARKILALNLVSSPGSGKTTLLEKTMTDLSSEMSMAVIEGDQQTSRDADRIEATGAKVVQVNTGSGCHLDGEMIDRALIQLEPKQGSVLFIENVGNLVCPAMFDLGEASKVVIISVPEGEDKPEKYPQMFIAAGLCIINKIDLLPYLDFDLDVCRDLARRINPELEFIEMSAATGQGLGRWYEWLRGKRAGCIR